MKISEGVGGGAAPPHDVRGSDLSSGSIHQQGGLGGGAAPSMMVRRSDDSTKGDDD